MFTAPQLEERGARHYAAIREQVTMQTLDEAIPRLTERVFGWLGEQGIAPHGAPFIRYLVIDMAAQLDVEIGVPVTRAVDSEGSVRAGTLPAGRYATLIYTGVRNGIAGNAALLDWGAARGFRWDSHATPHGEAFGARLESFLTDPADTPDMDAWETEVAIRLAGE